MCVYHLFAVVWFLSCFRFRSLVITWYLLPALSNITTAFFFASRHPGLWLNTVLCCTLHTVQRAYSSTAVTTSSRHVSYFQDLLISRNIRNRDMFVQYSQLESSQLECLQIEGLLHLTFCLLTSMSFINSLLYICLLPSSLMLRSLQTALAILLH